MHGSVRVICTSATVGGFRLAGLAPLEADVEAAAREVRKAMDDRATAVVLIEERLYSALPLALRQSLAGRPVPLMVPFPSPGWKPEAGEAEAFVTELLRQAIGYRVRLG